MTGRFFALRFAPLALAAAIPFAAAASGGTPSPEYKVETLRYDGRVAGVKVAEMTIENGVSSNALPYHKFTVRSVGAARLFSSVDTEMWSEVLDVGENACSLFVRNRPKRIRLSTDYPAFLEMDIENRYGTQRFRLVEWERDGQPFHPVDATD